MLQVGDQVEFKGNVWTVKDMCGFDNTPHARAFNDSIGIAAFAVLERNSKRRYQGIGRVFEAVARIKTGGTVDKFIA
jgi:hypothetical protein